MLTLRPYQQAAIDAVYDHLRARDDNPCVVIPTAGGKTPVMAMICKDAVTLHRKRVLILAHVKELLEQMADKLRQVCPEVGYGVYSAGLRRRDTTHSVIIAGIQSVYQRAGKLGKFDLILVDESHLIPADGEGMYRTFLADAKALNPHLRVIGFTATPYRLDSGTICGPGRLLQSICYEIGVRELISQGYLCPLTTKGGKSRPNTSGLHVRGGEFVAGEVEDLMDRDALVQAACAEIVEYTRDRQATLIFASGVKHGQHVIRVLKEQHGIECGFVNGETPSSERDELLARFRGAAGGELFSHKPLRYMCNVNVLTTGFDAPHIDCVVLLRPTMSPGLYYQMVGRGFRLHPNKQNCLVLDYGGNALRHGPIDAIQVKERDARGTGQAPAKECPKCHSIIATGYARCPDCSFEFPPPECTKHDATAGRVDILSGSGQATTTRYVVQDVYYYLHIKRGAPDSAPRSMRVNYKVGRRDYKSEWICFEHAGYARQKAVQWWKQRSREPVPQTAEEAVALAQAGRLATTHAITVRSVAGEYFDRIVDYELGDIPPALDDKELLEDALDFPFGANAVDAEEDIPW